MAPQIEVRSYPAQGARATALRLLRHGLRRDTARAMSQENVEIVRGIIDAHERGDAEAVFSKYDPEIEWHLSTVFARASEFEPVYYGHDGIRTFWRTWFSAWEKASFEYEEFIDAGDSVVTILSQHVRGRASGIELD